MADWQRTLRQFVLLWCLVFSLPSSLGQLQRSDSDSVLRWWLSDGCRFPCPCSELWERLKSTGELLSSLSGSLVGLSKTFCGNARQRRSSVDLEDRRKNQLAAFMVDATVNTSSCLSFRANTEFLKFSIDSLVGLTDFSIDLTRRLRSTTLAADAFNQASMLDAAASKLSDEEKKLLATLLSEVRAIENRTTVVALLQDWRKFMETYSAGNLRGCSGFVECVRQSFASLQGLPHASLTSASQFASDLLTIELLFENLMNTSLWSARNLSALSEYVKEISHRLDLIIRASLHCTAPPRLSSGSRGELLVEAGSAVSLFCGIVTSTLPVTFYWNQDSLLLGQTKADLHFISTVNSDGLYICTAKSAVGIARSLGVTVRVYSRPSVSIEPNTTFVYLPLSGVAVSPLLCNFTGKPTPTISWHYSSFSSRSATVLANETRSVFMFERSKIELSAGFYFCVASNAHGSIRSRAVAVHVLETVLPDMALTVKFIVMKVERNRVNVSSVHVDKTVFLPLAVLVSNIQKLDFGVVWHGFSGMFGSVALRFSVQKTHPELVSVPDMTARAKRARDYLATTAADLASVLYPRDYRVRVDNETVITLLNGTVAFSYQLNICQPGYNMAADGLLCAQCPAGSFGMIAGNCTLCKSGSYQPLPGQLSCTGCTGGSRRVEPGATSVEDCIKSSSSSAALVASMVLVVLVCAAAAYLFWRYRRSRASESSGAAVSSSFYRVGDGVALTDRSESKQNLTARASEKPGHGHINETYYDVDDHVIATGHPEDPGLYETPEVDFSARAIAKVQVSSRRGKTQANGAPSAAVDDCDYTMYDDDEFDDFPEDDEFDEKLYETLQADASDATHHIGERQEEVKPRTESKL